MRLVYLTVQLYIAERWKKAGTNIYDIILYDGYFCSQTNYTHTHTHTHTLSPRPAHVTTPPEVPIVDCSAVRDRIHTGEGSLESRCHALSSAACGAPIRAAAPELCAPSCVGPGGLGVSWVVRCPVNLSVWNPGGAARVFAATGSALWDLVSLGWWE